MKFSCLQSIINDSEREYSVHAWEWGVGGEALHQIFGRGCSAHDKKNGPNQIGFVKLRGQKDLRPMKKGSIGSKI